MTYTSESSETNRMETIESLTAKIAKIKKERAELAEQNWLLYDRFGAAADRKGAAKMEARMWAQECIHTDLEHQLFLMRIAVAKAAVPSANPPAHSQHPAAPETPPAVQMLDPVVSKSKDGEPAEPK